MTRASCLYEGMVRHRRFEPIEIGFRYPIQLLYLDLAELDGLFRGSRLWSTHGRAPARFHRADHLGPAEEPLEVSVRRLLASRLGRAPDGPIRLLTGPRMLGFVFNPISFYYCFETDGQTLSALVAETTNTPWGEHHCYVLDLMEPPSERSDGAHAQRRKTPKSFHASPYMEMGMNYEWRVRTPGRGLTLSVLSEFSKRPPATNREYGAPYSQADLVLNRRELDPASLRAAFWRAPLLPGRVLGAIYWQALRLAWRRVPFVKHPAVRWPRTFDDPELIDSAGIE
ncbi:MAG: DUF1365 domain-containing protein, partial [Deltaproteobacteria bacterium]|nr:DUF1365 domain-containing protein [Deltaproteobacteria bacterium]